MQTPFTEIDLITAKKHFEAGQSVQQVSDKLGRSYSGVYTVHKAYKKGKLDEWIKKMGQQEKHGQPGRPPRNAGRRKQILALHAQGWTQAAIARKLGIQPSTVFFYVKSERHSKSERVVLNGASRNGTAAAETNGTINKQILVGIAYAETERFITLLAERLGFPVSFLRQRLSELLGHSPLR